jgi:hypothetical protein
MDLLRRLSGGEGNRTPVRIPIPPKIYMLVLLFFVSLDRRPADGLSRASREISLTLPRRLGKPAWI